MLLLLRGRFSNWHYNHTKTMDKDFTTYHFTPDHPEISFNFNTGMKLTIKKFIMLSENQDFLSNHSLGFQIQTDNTTHPVKMFVSCISAMQVNPQVAEVNQIIQSEDRFNAVISIVNQGDPQDYSISMVYDIQPL